jgi:hypothetical protein
MITEEALSALVAEAGAAIPEPSGSDAIIAAARAETPPPSVVSPPSRSGVRSRGFAIKALGAAAAIVVVTALVSNSSAPQPSAIRAAALKTASGLGPTTLGLNATPAELGRSLPSAAVGSAAPASSSPGASVASSQKIITTGTLSLVVDKASLSHVVAELQAIATSFDGYVSTSNVALSGANRGGTVVLGIPAGDFQTAVSRAESLGTIKHLSTTATDVTGQVADLGAQVTALQAARAQLEALFARAGTIPALLSVQNEITSVQSQIQQLQAQQRVLANEISFSSLTVSLALPSAPHVSPPSGFSKAWHAAVMHFENGLSSLLADSGIVLFSILLVGLIGLIVLFGGRLAWSFVRRRQL